MTKRELEDIVREFHLFIADAFKEGKHYYRVYNGKTYRAAQGNKPLTECKTKRELEQFLSGVKVGKEMG